MEIDCRHLTNRSFWTLSGSPSLLATPELVNIANASSCTPAQALFKFAMMGGVTPLSGTTNEAHIEDGVAVPGLELEDPSGQLKILEKIVWGA